MAMKFKTVFQNSEGEEVAGAWFDEAVSRWRLSTVPIEDFETEQDAITFYRAKCNPKTGLL